MDYIAGRRCKTTLIRGRKYLRFFPGDDRESQIEMIYMLATKYLLSQPNRIRRKCAFGDRPSAVAPSTPLAGGFSAMWPFKVTPDKWRDVLDGCDFSVARKEIAHMFQTEAQSGRSRGEELYLAPELKRTLDAFLEDPSADTAVQLLDVAPMLASYFEQSKPGGVWKIYDDLLK